MAFVSKTKVDVEGYGRDVVVADNPKAKLMYYLDSVSSVLDLKNIQDPNVHRLR